MKTPPERLGSFYLGAKYDVEKGSILEEPINYDARDLTTHAICVGMTGSGKTGLCVCLLEEAALDQVPAIIIDPKGDITNLLLQFPDLNPKDFEPWINVDDARRKGMSVTEYSINIASTWKKGLEDWGIGNDRIKQLKDSVEYTIFTPGSDAGIPISIISSLTSPKLDFKVDGEAARDRIRGVVAALLDLMGLKLDPIRSIEGILLSNLFEYYWSRDEDLTFEKLITSIQKPPFSKLGVFELDTFYPAKERFQLAMTMNAILASPSFSSWLEGESLDVDKLLYNAKGGPRHSIFYLAHLSDSERMFFVTLLLESIVTWVRRQQGTTSLRAILYFDEVYGFMPPVAEPPSKKPLMTLLKQARAFGMGVTLVTQNPVDIDYKGLTNTGTWFIGKLQAERDKEKVIAGLKGAIIESGGIGQDTDYNLLINKLTSRVFILHNIHQGAPVVFQTRWAMSYLRGPLTKPQINELMKNRQRPEYFEKSFKTSNTSKNIETTSTPPNLDPKIQQVYISNQLLGEQSQTAFNQIIQPQRSETTITYEPIFMAKTTIGYYDKKLGIDQKTSEVILLTPDNEIEVRWNKAVRIPEGKLDYSRSAKINIQNPAIFKPIPDQINTADKLQKLGRSLTEYLFLNTRIKIPTHKELNIIQKQGEDERAFAIRLRDVARERRDSEVAKIQNSYENKISKIEDKMHSLERNLSSNEDEYQARKREEYLGVGETLLGFFIGRRKTTGITTASRRRRLTEKAKNEAQATQEELKTLKENIDELETELKNAVNEVTRKWDNVPNEVSFIELKPNRNDINIDILALAWLRVQT